LVISSESPALPSSIRNNSIQGATGRAGIIDLSIGRLTLNPHSIISSASAGGGNAGTVEVHGLGGKGTAANAITLDNSTISTTTIAGGNLSSVPANIKIAAQTINVANGAQITADTNGAAPAGAVTLTATESIALTSSSGISSSSRGLGNAGEVSLTAPTITLADSSSISSTTGSTGNAGAILIDGATVGVTNGAVINSSTSGAGNAGTVTIRATEAVTVAGSDPGTGFVSTVASATVVGTGAAGKVTIEAPSIEISDRGTVSTSNSPLGGRAGDIILDGQRVTINSGARVTSSTFSAAPGGTVTINGTDSVTIQGSGLTATATRLATATFFGGGPGGAITVTTNQLALDGAEIQAFTAFNGPAGSITLTAQDATITGGTQIESSSVFGAGPAGTISIASSNSLTVSGARPEGASPTRISSSGFSRGDAGTVTILAPALTLADGAEISTKGGDPNTTSGDTANAGAITVDAARVRIVGGAFLDSSTLGSGSGGSVTVRATEAITISGRDATGFLSGITTVSVGEGGNAGQIKLTTPELLLTDGANLSSNTAGENNAGSIQLNVGQLSILGEASITSRARIVGGLPVSGSGGNITIFGQSGAGTAANAVSLNNSRLVTSSEGSGNGGSIQMNANLISLNNTSLVSATNEGTGNAGSVTLQLTGLFSSQGSTVSSSATQGAGGNVSITAGNMNLNSGTTISAESAGSNDAGSIALTSASDLLMRNSTVTTSATQASGGNIKLTAPSIIRLVDSTLTSSVQGQARSNGGNITIDPQLVVIQNSQLLARANAGAGGVIKIDATGAVLVDPNSLLSATAGPAGVSGSVNINAPIQVLSGALVPLNLVYSQAGLSGDRCAADPQGQFSSFVQTGRDGVPQIPGALSPSPLSFLEPLTSGSLGSPTPSFAAARLGLDSVSVNDSPLFRFHSACRS
jgi:large exoprotein involved in heme utilization and adhesion